MAIENCKWQITDDIRSIYKKMMLLAKAHAFKVTKSAGVLAT